MPSGIFLKSIPEIGKKILPILGNIGKIFQPIALTSKMLFSIMQVI